MDLRRTDIVHGVVISLKFRAIIDPSFNRHLAIVREIDGFGASGHIDVRFLHVREVFYFAPIARRFIVMSKSVIRNESAS